MTKNNKKDIQKIEKTLKKIHKNLNELGLISGLIILYDEENDRGIADSHGIITKDTAEILIDIFDSHILNVVVDEKDIH